MTCTLKTLATLSILGLGLAAYAQTDGTYKAAYGTPIKIQDTKTGYGDSSLGTVDYANGSELNGAYAYRTWNAVKLFIPGNVETNFNRLNVMFDSVAGGQNQLLQGQSEISFGSIKRLAGDGVGPGLKFDAGVEPDFGVITSGGGSPCTFYIDGYIVGNSTGRVGNNPDNRGGFYLGNSQGTALTGGGQVDLGFDLGFNNSNIAGVEGGGGVSTLGSTGLATGIELSIPLGFLNNTNGAIKVVAFIANGGNGGLSNQFVNGIQEDPFSYPDPRYTDLSLFPNDQYFTIPASSAFRTVSGTVNFLGAQASKLSRADVYDATGATLIGSNVIQVDDSGNYKMNLPGNAGYKIAVKPRGFVQTVITIPAGASNATASFSLRPGNIDNDDVVSVFDYIALSDAFDSVHDIDPVADGFQYGPGWNPDADLDGDDVISVFDYILLSDNFDAQDDSL